MAATARALTKATTATMVAVVLVLVLALATVDGNSQCTKYPIEQLRSTQFLLHNMELAPVGSATVNCNDREKDCLVRSRLLMRDGSCVLLGSPCTLQDGKLGMVRASLDEWRARRRLVGECAPRPRCNDTHVLVRRQWQAPASRCALVGHLLCACACQAPPPSLFPDCECDEGPTLQLAPFGGYECAHTCRGTCSPQIGRPTGNCVFPPLAVHPLAVVHATDVVRRSPMFARLYQLMPAQPQADHPLAVEGPSDIVRRSPILGRMYQLLPEPQTNKGCVLKDYAPGASIASQRLNPLASRSVDITP